MNERNMLLKRIQICDFALNDAALFLDVNPDDQAALAYYKKYQALREKAVTEYVAKYGPLARNDYDGGPRWKWTDNPWPWHLEEV